MRLTASNNMAHREGVREFMKDLILENVRVVDWGCGTKPIKNFVPNTGCEFLGIDKLDHVGADMVADIAQPMELGRMFDVAFCIEVLEHVKYPAVVLQNIHRHLKPGGTLYLSAPFRYPIHSEEDYWRFTDQGLKFLLESNGFMLDRIKQTTDEYDGWTLRATRE